MPDTLDESPSLLYLRQVTDAQLLTTAQVAEKLRTSVSTVQRLADRGALPYELKMPGKTGSYLFARTVVEMYLASKAS